MATYIDLILSRLPPKPFKGTLAEGFAGLVGGLMANLMAEGASVALQALWLIQGQPEDNLGYAGAAKGRLFRYIAETAEAYRLRLEQAIELWERGGSEDVLGEQLEAAGYVGSSIHSPLDWTRAPLDWPTQFWGFIPRSAQLDGSPFHRAGDGTLCGSPQAIAGTGTYFKHAKRLDRADAIIDGHLVGITGPVERVVELQKMIRTFKAGYEVCRQILIEVDGHACGGGTLCGSGAKCGGEVVAIGTGVPE